MKNISCFSEGVIEIFLYRSSFKLRLNSLVNKCFVLLSDLLREFFKNFLYTIIIYFWLNIVPIYFEDIQKRIELFIDSHRHIIKTNIFLVQQTL
jgi:hypothetical protein